MGTSFENNTLTLVSGGALSAGQLVYDVTGTATACTAASTKHVGVVARDVAASGDQVCILLPTAGIVPVLTGGTVTHNDALAYGAAGTVVTAGANDSIIGFAASSGGSGTLIAAVLYQCATADASLKSAIRDTATVTVDLAVNTNTLTLNGKVLAFGAGAWADGLIGAAVTAGSTAVKDAANAALLATALALCDDVASATSALGVVTVTAKDGRCLSFTDVTATRLTVAYTAPSYSVFGVLRALAAAIV